MSIFNAPLPNYEGEGQPSATTSNGLLGGLLSLDLFGAAKPTYVGEGQPKDTMVSSFALLTGMLDGLLFTAPETKYLAAPPSGPGRGPNDNG